MTLLRIGVSACLLGEQVRFDGGHKRSARLVNDLGPFVEWVPICPEVEIGLGTPRPTIRLQDVDGETRLLEPSSGRDLSDTMHEWSAQYFEGEAPVDGWILKKGSPSCGMDKVKRYVNTIPSPDGVGVFAQYALQQGVPVTDEGRMQHALMRERFLEHALSLRRWTGANIETVSDLIAFHSNQKLTYMSHSPKHAKTLGQIVANAKADLDGALKAYDQEVRACLAEPATQGRHRNVMEHMAGYLNLDAEDKAELVDAIQAYTDGLLPHIVPLTLLKHHLRHAPEWLQSQSYIDPYPREWLLRHG